MYREDSNSFNGSINAGNSLSDSSNRLEVQTHRADYVYIWVDDGNTGTNAGSYDIELDVFKSATHFSNDWLRDFEKTGTTAVRTRVEATGSKARLNIANQSGSNGNYRIFFESFVQDI